MIQVPVCPLGAAVVIVELRDIHARGGGFDRAPIAAVGGTCVQRPGNIDAAILTAAEELDCAVVRANSLGLDDACVVHRGFEQLARGLRGHHDLSAIGQDQAAVLDQGLHCASVDVTLSKPFPTTSSVMALPAANVTEPSRAAMVP